MTAPLDIDGLLCDLDGVLHVDNAAIPGAVEAIDRLRERGLALRFLTNTTTRPRSAVAARLAALGFAIPEAEIFTAPRAAAALLRAHGHTRCRLVLNDAVKEEFAGLEADGDAVDAVVIGDIGPAWNHALLEGIFTTIMGGAELVALHKGRYWQTGGGLALDIGAYVAGLEYVTGRSATVCGKPSPAFFEGALADLGLTAERVVMVGDDIESDVGGAQACGLRGALVRTGKYRSEHVARSSVTPDLVLANIAALIEHLG